MQKSGDLQHIKRQQVKETEQVKVIERFSIEPEFEVDEAEEEHFKNQQKSHQDIQINSGKHLVARLLSSQQISKCSSQVTQFSVENHYKKYTNNLTNFGPSLQSSLNSESLVHMIRASKNNNDTHGQQDIPMQQEEITNKIQKEDEKNYPANHNASYQKQSKGYIHFQDQQQILLNQQALNEQENFRIIKHARQYSHQTDINSNVLMGSISFEDDQISQQQLLQGRQSEISSILFKNQQKSNQEYKLQIHNHNQNLIEYQPSNKTTNQQLNTSPQFLFTATESLNKENTSNSKNNSGISRYKITDQFVRSHKKSPSQLGNRTSNLRQSLQVSQSIQDFDILLRNSNSKNRSNSKNKQSSPSKSLIKSQIFTSSDGFSKLLKSQSQSQISSINQKSRQAKNMQIEGLTSSNSLISYNKSVNQSAKKQQSFLNGKSTSIVQRSYTNLHSAHDSKTSPIRQSQGSICNNTLNITQLLRSSQNGLTTSNNMNNMSILNDSNFAGINGVQQNANQNTESQMYFMNLNDLLQNKINDQMQILIQMKKDMQQKLKDQQLILNKEQQYLKSQQQTEQLLTQEVQHVTSIQTSYQQINKDLQDSIMTVQLKTVNKGEDYTQEINVLTQQFQQEKQNYENMIRDHEYLKNQENSRIYEQNQELNFLENKIQESDDLIKLMNVDYKNKAHAEQNLTKLVQVNNDQMNRIITIDHVDNLFQSQKQQQQQSKHEKNKGSISSNFNQNSSIPTATININHNINLNSVMNTNTRRAHTTMNSARGSQTHSRNQSKTNISKGILQSQQNNKK